MENRGSNYKPYGNLPKTMFTARTRSALESPNVPKSNSAMSTRTYSRIKGQTDTGMGVIRKNMNFEENEVSLLDESLPGIEELENEQELLNRMMDQQKQLQQLKERQTRLLDLQQQLAKMDYKAGNSMEEKLKKLKTAKSRLDQLQQLVGTIKAAESEDGDGSNAMENDINSKTQYVKMALDELNDLKSLINMLAPGQDQSDDFMPHIQPVFANVINSADGISEDGYEPVLPEVSVVEQDDDDKSAGDQNSLMNRHNSSKKKVKRATDGSTPSKAVQRVKIYDQNERKQKQSPVANKEENPEVSIQLYKEMKRHEILLEELRERRKELEDLMNMTDMTKVESERNVDYDDGNSSTRSNLGSPDESRGFSDNDADDFDTSQSGRLFGLNEIQTRRLIDIIRSQKNLGAATEKTTATWGSSSESDDELLENGEDQSLAPYDDEDEQERGEFKKSSEAINIQESLSLMHEPRNLNDQDNYKLEQQEIDLRSMTKRYPGGPGKEMTALTASVQREKLQEDLANSNTAMRLLLEDQQALTRLLQNTLNLQQTNLTNSMCYGISPDFLIYQLDNCSAQFSSLQKETKSLQWQLYDLIKNNPSDMKPVGDKHHSSPFALQPLVPLQQKTNMLPCESNEFALLMQNNQSSSKEEKQQIPLEEEYFQSRYQDDRQQYSLDRKSKNIPLDDASDADLFETLRDSIYSGAAILISQNESRPHFLIELFHYLQQLNTDYLRQHCLYVLQDILKGYLPDSPKKTADGEKFPSPRNKSGRGLKQASYSENTPSESAATSDDELYAKLKAKASADAGYDFTLKVSSASELSTPSGDEIENNPFAADDLGSTVIHLDAALRHMREMERMKQEILGSSEGRRRIEEIQDSELSGGDGPKKSVRELKVPQINTKLLKAKIKHIISEIIPLLKSDRDETINHKFVKKLKEKVLAYVTQSTQFSETNGVLAEDSEAEEKNSMTIFFSGQLNSILEDCFKKFVGRSVGTCGEDLVVSLSEVLFNELAFFDMMQDLGKDKAQPIESIPNVKEVDEDGDADSKGEPQSMGPCQVTIDEVKSENEVHSNLITNGDRSTSLEKIPEPGSIQEGDFEPPKTAPVTVDLSVSETKPLTSYGSGEDEEDGSGDEYMYEEQDVPTSMQHDQDNEASNKDDNEEASVDGEEEKDEEEPSSDKD